MPWSDGLGTTTPAYAIAASERDNVRVIAGPGSGKSFAMKRRVARLLESGVEPDSILPVTFTRVAAEDLHRELLGLSVPGCNQLKATTLHSLAMGILMRHHVLQATGRTPRPLNEYELRPLEQDLQRLGHGNLHALRKRLKAYEAAWARLQDDEPGVVQEPEDHALANDLIRWLMFHNAMLIGEVIPELHKYLRSNPGAPERLEYTHILVDEYQDLNKAEQGVIDLLSDNATVCIVGDDDQSIYSFKHAHPDGIREWIELKDNTDDLTLTECRRCPTRVTAMANSLISHNALRPETRQLIPRAENGPGNVHIVQYATLDHEVEGVASLVAGLIGTGTAPGDILILAQRGAVGTPIYERLQALDVSVSSYYAESELEAEQAQRRFSLLKLFVNRDDRVALRWLLGHESDNWRGPAYARLWRHCQNSGTTPWQVLTELSMGILSIAYTGPLVERFHAIRDEVSTMEGLEGLTGVVDYVFPEGAIEVKTLRTTALAVLETVDSNDPQRFLGALISAIAKPEVPSEVSDVRIMSLHKSKGLSAPVTIIAGCVEGLLPTRPGDDLTPAERAAHMEEQRRLFYVGITRVKASPDTGRPGDLVLTYSQRMPLATAMRAGISPASVSFGTANLLASRFIAELGAQAPAPVTTTPLPGAH